MKKPYTKKQIQEAIAYWEKQLAEGNYRKVNERLNYENVMYNLDYHRSRGNMIEFFADGRAWNVESAKKDGGTLVLSAKRPGSSRISVRTFVAMIREAGFKSPDDVQRVVLQIADGDEYILDQTFDNAVTSKVYGLQSEKLEWYFKRPRGW